NFCTFVSGLAVEWRCRPSANFFVIFVIFFCRVADPLGSAMKNFLSLAVFAFVSYFSYAQRDTVIVRPVPVNDVLINPNMGITTFNRFNGQATNPPLEWSEVGPITRLPQAATKPDFPDTSIAYLRWYWTALEPEQGKIRWDIIDLALEEPRAHGQTMAIRLMPYTNK